MAEGHAPARARRRGAAVTSTVPIGVAAADPGRGAAAAPQLPPRPRHGAGRQQGHEVAWEQFDVGAAAHAVGPSRHAPVVSPLARGRRRRSSSRAAASPTASTGRTGRWPRCGSTAASCWPPGRGRRCGARRSGTRPRREWGGVPIVTQWREAGLDRLAARRRRASTSPRGEQVVRVDRRIRARRPRALRRPSRVASSTPSGRMARSAIDHTLRVPTGQSRPGCLASGCS